MQLKLWESHPIPHSDDSLFSAIVTAENGKQLIAQCTSLEFAEHIVSMNNNMYHGKVHQAARLPDAPGLTQ